MENLKIFFVSGVLSLTSLGALAKPAQVILIRHAEKPPIGNEVSVQGCYRAFLLPQFFSTNPIVNAFGPPVAFYAMAPAKTDGTLRPIQTLVPTVSAMAQRLISPYNKVLAPYVKGEGEALAAELLASVAFNQKTVVVAWEHKDLINVAKALGLDAVDSTGKWPSAVYDEAWVLQWDKEGSVSLNIIPEQVLSTDNPQGGVTHWMDGPSDGDSSLALPEDLITKCRNNDALNALMKIEN